MKRFLLLLTFLISCGSNSSLEDKGAPDGGYQDTTTLPDTKSPLSLVPPKFFEPIQSVEAYEYICSPPGIYLFKATVYLNNCSESIVPEMYWESTKELPSYNCGVYWYDGYSNHKLDPTVIVYCDYYTYCEPCGIKLDTKCIVYSLITLEEVVVCKFSYATPWTQPQGWLGSDRSD